MMDATTRLILVRHGQTSANLAKLLSGSTDHDLDETGERQAQLVARRIASEFDAHALVSSPLSRARSTAMAISNLTGLEIQEMHDLREVSFGDFEGLPVDRIESDWPEVARQMLDPHDTSLRWPNGEHMLEFYERTRTAFSVLASEHADKDDRRSCAWRCDWRVPATCERPTNQCLAHPESAQLLDLSRGCAGRHPHRDPQQRLRASGRRTLPPPRNENDDRQRPR